MKPSRTILVFLLSCAACSAGGWWLARAAPRAQRSGNAGSAERAGRNGASAAPGGKADDGGGKVAGIPLTTPELLRRAIAQAGTVELWQWYASEGRRECNEEIAAALVERLGWVAAWDQSLALADPGQRSRAAEGVLTELAKRDPWRAFEMWRDHWKELCPPGQEAWGVKAMVIALNGMGQAPASQMIEMIGSLKELPRFEVRLMLEYRADFDFAAVVDFLDQVQPPPEPREDEIPPLPSAAKVLQPSNLLDEWGRRSPVALSQWLLEHAKISTPDEPWQWQSQADWALHQIAGRSADTPGRAEALEILGRLPEKYLEDSWRGSDYGYDPDSRNKLSLSELEAATQMNQREAYLTGAFGGLPSTDEIDPSWQQLPVEDRQPLLDEIEKDRHRYEEPTPVEQEAWERWLKRMKAVWGME